MILLQSCGRYHTAKKGPYHCEVKLETFYRNIKGWHRGKHLCNEPPDLLSIIELFFPVGKCFPSILHWQVESAVSIGKNKFRAVWRINRIRSPPIIIPPNTINGGWCSKRVKLLYPPPINVISFSTPVYNNKKMLKVIFPSVTQTHSHRTTLEKLNGRRFQTHLSNSFIHRLDSSRRFSVRLMGSPVVEPSSSAIPVYLLVKLMMRNTTGVKVK